MIHLFSEEKNLLIEEVLLFFESMGCESYYSNTHLTKYSDWNFSSWIMAFLSVNEKADITVLQYKNHLNLSFKHHCKQDAWVVR